MSKPMQRAVPYIPFLEFLAEAGCESDEDLVELMDGIADTLGDMFGFQSDRYEAVERFVTRLQAAADAAALSQSMAKN
jgi:hypothetical protein